MTEPYMQPEDVPDALASAGVSAWPDTSDERPTIEDIVRHVLAEVLPEHEDTIRAKVSAEILAAKGTDPRFPEGWASTRDRDHAAAIALNGLTHPNKETRS